MSRAYSLDLRERVVASMRGGLSSYKAAARYQVSQSSAQRSFNRALVQGSPAALPVGGGRGFLLADKLEWITRRLAEAPDTTLRSLLRELREAGVDVSYFGVWNFVHNAGLSYKKVCTPANKTVRTWRASGSSGSATRARLTPRA